MEDDRTLPRPASDLDRFEELFHRVLGQPASSRRQYLEVQCRDPAMRRRIESLLDADREVERARSEQGDAFEAAVQRAASEAIDLKARAETQNENREQPPAQLLDGYCLLRTLGHGGMGTVYLAERAGEDFQLPVAIKVVRNELLQPGLIERLRGERRLLAELDHPNIARLFDGGTTPSGSPYLVMEYVEGTPIDVYCDRRRLSVDRRIELFRDVCEAVHCAHRNLIVHRDLKPSNILVTEEGVVKLLDFGIAKRDDLDGPGAQATRTLDRALTPQYASPEQIRGQRVTTASDVYSLGVLLYELISGRPPYRLSSLSPAEIERAVCDSAPIPPSTASTTMTSAEQDPELSAVAAARDSSLEALRQRLRGDLDTVVLKALHKEPERRYSSAAELGEDLDRHLRGMPVSARPDTWRYRATKFTQRHPLGVAAAMLALLGVVGFAIAMAVLAGRLARERDYAERQEAKANQVVDFVVDVFEATDPSVNRGLELSAGEILDRGRTKLDAFEGSAEVRAAVAEAIGKVYRNLAQYDQAERLLAEAIANHEQALGPDHPETGDSVQELGRLQRLRGNLAESEALYRRALAIRIASYGAEHPLVADTLNSLGTIRQDQGDYEEAGRFYQEALRQRETLLGRDHPLTGATVSNLGDLEAELGNREDAVELLARALDIARKARGDEHLEVAVALNNLAVTVEGLGRYSEAESHYLESLAIRERLLPPGHSSILKAQANLATLYLRQRQLERSVGMLEPVIAARRASPSSALDLAVPLSNYGFALRGLGRLDEARAALLESVELMERELGPDHAYVANPVANLSAVLFDLGDFSGAERQLRRALEIRRQALPDAHPATATNLHTLGGLLIEGSRYEEAAEELQQAIEMRRSVDERRLADSMTLLGLVRLEQARTEEARALAREALAAASASSPDASPPSRAVERARCLLALVDQEAGVESDSPGVSPSSCSEVDVAAKTWGNTLWRKWLP